MPEPRQAIVVIHGMGEQRPMAFLRQFVRCLLVRPSEEYFSKPDPLAATFEVRKFTLRANDEIDRLRTDLYEYYWAHHMVGNRLGHLWPLIQAVFLKWPWHVSSSLRVLWGFGWGVVVVIAFVALTRPTWVGTARTLVGGTIVAALLAAGVRGAQRWLVGSFGDAARYLSPSPGNVAIRQKIRAEATELLQKLHDTQKYSRIVVLGHSLGSVIGLDAIAQLWSRHHKGWHGCTGTPEKQPALDTVSALTRRWNGQSNVEHFQSAQYALWGEQRSQGSPWLITDFITVGSPLAHAHMLMARNADELRDIQRLRELPRCPPQIDGRSIAFPDSVECNHQGKFRVLHHAAMFGCVRWTNVWFRCRFGVTGDWFGGSLRRTFGGGIRELEVDAGHWRRKLPLLPHTYYFRDEPATADGRMTSKRALLDALGLRALGRPAQQPPVTVVDESEI